MLQIIGIFGIILRFFCEIFVYMHHEISMKDQ